MRLLDARLGASEDKTGPCNRLRISEPGRGRRKRDPNSINFRKLNFLSIYMGLCEIHQIHTVMRSGEYLPGETASGPPAADAGAQPLSHNPRKQRKNPAVAG